jgi:lipopolysaccharide/colanic/teichoic acid biosynthesis glycosyltransferase
MRSLLIKRVIDLVGAAALLASAAPAMLAIALLIRWRMGRPVLFRQVRPGYRGRPFTLLKFRTMREAFGPDGALLPDTQRITPLGRWLRRTSLDELPQLINVLFGQMSLFGPRPLLIEYLDRYTPEQARRHDVKPGLTGWAQVNGRNALSWEEKFALDVWYAEHWSLGLDARILLSTLWKVLRREGVGHAAEETMPVFLGSATRPGFPHCRSAIDRREAPPGAHTLESGARQR